MKHKKPTLALVTLPLSKFGEIFVVQLLQIIEPLCNKVYLITGNFAGKANERVQIINIASAHAKYKTPDKIGPIWIRTLRFIITQLRISANLMKVSKNADIVFSYLGELNLLPMLCSKLLKKKTAMFYLSGNKPYETFLTEPPGLSRIVVPMIAEVLQRTNLALADQVILEAENTVDWGGLNKYRDKISIKGARYVDTNLFSIKVELKDKKELVGFIGRHSPEKGIVNFVNAIPLISKERDNVKFLIGGSGPLSDEIRGKLKSNKYYDKVKFVGWIYHDDLPKYLNQLKLLVLPSYTEQLPSIMLEGMACGTLMLATPVGGIPSIIKDEETGFILEDNSAESIARGVLIALNHPRLLEITKKARALIEHRYSYEAAIRRYKSILTTLS